MKMNNNMRDRKRKEEKLWILILLYEGGTYKKEENFHSSCIHHWKQSGKKDQGETAKEEDGVVD